MTERGPEFRRLRDLLYQKYPQYPEEAALEPSDSVIIEVTPTHVFPWGLESPAAPAVWRRRARRAGGPEANEPRYGVVLLAPANRDGLDSIA